VATATAQKLTGHQKIAVLCMSLGMDSAAEMMRRLSPKDAESVATEIAQMEAVDPATAQAVLEEWERMEDAARSMAGGGAGYARELLERTFDTNKAAAVMSRLSDREGGGAARFGLDDAEPRQLTNLLRDEHPQTVALVLAFLPDVTSARVIELLGPDLSTDIMHRMATMEKVAPEVLEIVQEAVRLGSRTFIAGDLSEAGGAETVAAVMNRVKKGEDTQIFEGLQKRAPGVFDRIKHLMFVFEDLINLDKKSLQKLLQNVESKQLALSLKVAGDALTEKIEGVMSQRALSAVKTEMDFLGAVRVSEVEEAQGQVIAAARQLEAAGEIVLSTGEGDDFID